MDAVETDAPEMMGRPYNPIGTEEYAALGKMFIGDPARPLSGYLAGKDRGGVYVQALENEWQQAFDVKHAIACNSATSGLLAAAFAAGLKAGTAFICPAITMTATAAAPMFTGARPVFCDIEDETFALNNITPSYYVRAIFVTNLFGHPARLQFLRQIADDTKTILIEDAAQSPFAVEHGRWAGTVGHIGVFSLNVHKHFHCGEGGMIVTNEDHLAWHMRGFINHYEHVFPRIGLNLRMPETSAAIAIMQLRKGRKLVLDRREQALAILDAIGDVPGITLPAERTDCLSSWYIIPFLVEHHRAELCYALRHLGVPVTAGYQTPLYRLGAFSRWKMDGCPVAEDLEDRRLFHIENCAHTFTSAEIERIGEAFKRAAEAIDAKAPRRL